MRIKQISDEVFVVDEPLVAISANEVEFLKEKVRNTPRQRVRLSAHRTDDDPLHEMIIVLGQDSYIRPHKHLGKSESFHIIEGTVDVVIFDDSGEIRQVVSMSSNDKAASFFYRLSEARFHTIIVRSPLLVIHEITSGPFRREDTIYPSWAPEETFAEEAGLFKADLLKRLAERG